MIEAMNSTRLVAPISPEEVEKTDKTVAKSVLRQTLYKGVSFMKKSFSRSNSLSGGSMHSTCSADSNASTSDDFSLADITIEVGRRSCMKGSRCSRKGKKALRVRMKKTQDKVYLIEPYFEFAADLWYTKKDERDIFTQPGIETFADSAHAETYMNIYTQARKQVYPKAWMDGTTNVSPAKPELLSSKLYDEIVKGRIHGFAGLEQYCMMIKKNRRVHVQQTVLMTVCAHHKATTNEKLGSDEKCKIVRNCSKSLSAVDRYWATAMGQADADAAAEVYRSCNLVVDNEKGDPILHQ